MSPALSPDSRRVPVRAEDGHQFELFCAGDPDDVPLLFYPALGVGSSYYERFAQSLANAGFFTVIGELRGQGTSSVRASREVDYGYREILEFDLPAASGWVREQTQRELIVGGHSLGGQVALLAAPHLEAERVAMVASCLPYHKGWTGPARFGILGVTYLFDAIAGTLGVFPGDRLGFGGRDGKTIMADWGHCVRTGRYEPRDSTVDWHGALREFDRPILVASVEDDSWAPEPAVELLFEEAPRADAVRNVVRVSAPGKPHFAWVKEHGAVVEAFARFARL